tara:strand:- start:7779 stop:8333 length:555 start_codon:yes stop_codon:yes gene_type:complete
MELFSNTENLLYKTIFDTGFVCHYTSIDNEKIKKTLLNDSKNKKDYSTVFNDMQLTRQKDIIWILDYIRDYHKTSNKTEKTKNKTLAACNIFLNVEHKNEMSPLRHHFNYQDPTKSPKMTVMYFVSGGGELYVKHKTLDQEETWSSIKIEEKMYVVFNAEIPYLRTPNPLEEPRITLTWPCLYL